MVRRAHRLGALGPAQRTKAHLFQGCREGKTLAQEVLNLGDEGKTLQGECLRGRNRRFVFHWGGFSAPSRRREANPFVGLYPPGGAAGFDQLRRGVQPRADPRLSIEKPLQTLDLQGAIRQPPRWQHRDGVATQRTKNAARQNARRRSVCHSADSNRGGANVRDNPVGNGADPPGNCQRGLECPAKNRISLCEASTDYPREPETSATSHPGDGCIPPPRKSAERHTIAPWLNIGSAKSVSFGGIGCSTQPGGTANCVLPRAYLTILARACFDAEDIGEVVRRFLANDVAHPTRLPPCVQFATGADRMGSRPVFGNRVLSKSPRTQVCLTFAPFFQARQKG